MTGIEKIIYQIESDTKLVCDEIISGAETKARSIIDEAKIEAAKLASDIAKSCDAQCADIAVRAKSSAALEERKINLVTKQKIINTMINATKAYIESLDDDHYFGLILRMIENNSSEKDGVIAFSKRDLDRLPKDFMNIANHVSRGELTLSLHAANIKSGFILIYDDIEENCSFDAVFESKREKLSDEVSLLLF